MQKIRKAVIPAAGLGTRVLPATKAMPKEMLPIVDKPAIQYIVEEAVAAGIEEILIITGRGKGIMEDHFDRAPELEAARRFAASAWTVSTTLTIKTSPACASTFPSARRSFPAALPVPALSISVS